MKGIGILSFLAVAAVASASSVTFNFSGLAENATTTQIQNYMDAALTAAGCTGCTVTVTGAFADTSWNGDGHVTGPGSGGTSLTLGTMSGVPSGSNSTSTVVTPAKTFLATTADGDAGTDTQITMKFSGFTINGSASFDYEIFPNFSCTALNATNCGGSAVGGIYPNQPDFVFDTNGSTNIFTTYGVTPGTTNGNATHSPNSGSGSSELAPQFIGNWSGSLSGVSQLDFIDWPATIGVDGLSVSWNTSSPVPDPSSVLLFGTVVAGIALRKKLRKIA
jgi:hypothetical protein